MRLLWITLCGIALLVGLARPALAQSEADRAQARQLAIEANEALEKKDFTTAADKFGRADALFHAPTLLLGVARAHVGLGKLVVAAEAYRRVVREGAPPDQPKFLEAIEEAKKELAALEPRVPSLTLNVMGPDQPDVTLDGVALPPAGLGIKRPIDPGSHTVRASATGFVPQERTFTVPEGANETFALILERDGGAAAPGPVPPPVQPSPAPDSSGDGSMLKTLGIVGLVVGGVGIVGGSVTGALAMKEHSVLKDDCKGGKCPSSRKDTLDNFRTLATVSTIGFVVGGVGTVGGIALLVLAPSSSDASAKAGVRPVLGPGTIGAVGRF